MLPNLLIIGAAKSGTTALHEYLALHPEIGMSARKELHFFTRDDWRERVGWYAQQFPDGKPIRGEASPDYTMVPALPQAAGRIAELIPDAKLLYILREPIDRAIAHYVEFVALTMEDRPIEIALGDLTDPANPYLAASRFASQLELFRANFDPSQILVLDQLDLLRDRARTLRAIFRFLDVDPTFSTPEFWATHNPRDTKIRYRRIGIWLMKRRLLAHRGTRNSRGPLIQPLRSLLSTPIVTELSPHLVERLVDHLDPEVRRLRVMTGMEFANWPRFRLFSRRRC